MTIAAVVQACTLMTVMGAPPEGIRLVGFTTVDPTVRDRSGLSEALESGTPRDRLGSFGSGIAYTGVGNRYLMVADRGPRDGKDSFHCRWQEVEITLGGGSAVGFSLVGTRLLSQNKVPLLGLAAYTQPSAGGVRFDPEGVRVLPDGSVLVADEYGPRVARFERATGELVKEYVLPPGYMAEQPLADAKEETAANVRGRVTNNGLEGLAVSPDGSRAFALMQGALIQDGGKDGENLRLLEIDLETGATRQMVYCVSSRGSRTNEILTASEHRFLVIERDGAKGLAARNKRIMLIDIEGATDISGRASLPSRAADLPSDIRPVKKQMLIDLLDLDDRIDCERFPEKVEGLAFGPDFSERELCLIVTSDNDFLADQPTWIWAIGIERRLLEDFTLQRFDGAAGKQGDQ